MDITETALLRGKIKILQPKKGFRTSLDTVFLAAGTPVKDRHKILDVGCGVGSAGLCVLARNKTVFLTGIDIQQSLVDLALQNAALNGMADRCQFFQGHILTDKRIADNAFHTVMMNPPYQEGGSHMHSPLESKALAHGEDGSGATLEDWIKYAHKKLKQGGTLALVHRADRLDDILLHLTKRKWFGSVIVFPLWPHAGEEAKRVIIRARKERYAPLALKSGMIIHNSDGSYTKEAQKILDAPGELDIA